MPALYLIPEEALNSIFNRSDQHIVNWVGRFEFVLNRERIQQAFDLVAPDQDTVLLYACRKSVGGILPDMERDAFERRNVNEHPLRRIAPNLCNKR